MPEDCFSFIRLGTFVCTPKIGKEHYSRFSAHRASHPFFWVQGSCSYRLFFGRHPSVNNTVSSAFTLVIAAPFKTFNFSSLIIKGSV